MHNEKPLACEIYTWLWLPVVLGMNIFSVLHDGNRPSIREMAPYSNSRNGVFTRLLSQKFDLVYSWHVHVQQSRVLHTCPSCRRHTYCYGPIIKSNNWGSLEMQV